MGLFGNGGREISRLATENADLKQQLADSQSREMTGVVAGIADTILRYMDEFVESGGVSDPTSGIVYGDAGVAHDNAFLQAVADHAVEVVTSIEPEKRIDLLRRALGEDKFAEVAMAGVTAAIVSYPEGITDALTPDQLMRFVNNKRSRDEAVTEALRTKLFGPHKQGAPVGELLRLAEKQRRFAIQDIMTGSKVGIIMSTKLGDQTIAFNGTIVTEPGLDNWLRVDSSAYSYQGSWHEMYESLTNYNGILTPKKYVRIGSVVNGAYYQHLDLDHNVDSPVFITTSNSKITILPNPMRVKSAMVGGDQIVAA